MYDNDLVCNSVYNFDKYSVSNFNEIASVNSKFDTLNKFIKFLRNLKVLKFELMKQSKRKKL